MSALRKLGFLAVVMGLAGCSSMKPAAYSTQKVDFPSLSEAHKAEVGERLVEQGSIKTFPGIRALGDGYCLNFAGAGPVITSGDTLQKFYAGKSAMYCDTGKIQTAFGQVWEGQRCLRQKDSGEFFFDLGDVCTMSFEEGNFSTVSADNFQRTLYYKGKSGNQVYFDYREFKNDMARPAFTQELIFDLSEGKTVGFRGLRLEIISATNTQIEYVVVQNFSDR